MKDIEKNDEAVLAFSHIYQQDESIISIPFVLTMLMHVIIYCTIVYIGSMGIIQIKITPITEKIEQQKTIHKKE